MAIKNKNRCIKCIHLSYRVLARLEKKFLGGLRVQADDDLCAFGSIDTAGPGDLQRGIDVREMLGEEGIQLVLESNTILASP